MTQAAPGAAADAAAPTFQVPADHPCLPGHFPGRPVVPSVVLLDFVLEAVGQAHPGRRPAGLPMVKFLRPVRPGQDVAIHLQAAGDRIGVSCTVDAQEVLRGTVLLAPAPPDPAPPSPALSNLALPDLA